MIRYKGFECDTTEEAVALMRALDGITPSAGDGGWIPWNGGECPVPYDTVVDVMFQNGERCEGEEAGGWVWNSSQETHSIVKYRVVK